MSPEHFLDWRTRAEEEKLSVPAVFEKIVIEEAMRRVDFNYAQAAKLLRMARSTLYDRCGRYKIRPSKGGAR